MSKGLLTRRSQTLEIILPTPSEKEKGKSNKTSLLDSFNPRIVDDQIARFEKDV